MNQQTQHIDTLDITGLSVATHIGTYAFEQRILQRLLIDLSMETDVRYCQDELNQVIDYEALCQAVTDFVESNSFALIETVANQVAELIKTKFKVEKLSVRISKPHAIKNAKNISICVMR